MAGFSCHFKPVYSIRLDLKPGETISVKIGGDGLQVDGKVQLTGDIADKIDLRYGIHRLIRVDGGQIAVPDHASDVGDFYAGEQRTYEEKLAGNSGDIRGMEQHTVKLSPEGTMLINGVRPGAYRLLFKVYEPPSGCLIDPVGYGFLEFHTNDYQMVNNRINLGTININLKPVPKVGDELAAFSWKDADGKATQLKDLRGQFVLLDFWATWCAPCLQSIPRLQQLHEQNLANKELMIVSLNIDEKPETGIEYVREQKLTWKHGFLGDLSATSSGAALGVTTVPLFILVDPQGKVAARSTSLDEILKSHPQIFAAAVLPKPVGDIKVAIGVPSAETNSANSGVDETTLSPFNASKTEAIERLASIQIEGNSVVTDSTIKTMIQVKAQDCISEESIRESCRALMDSRLFYSVKTRFDETPSGAALVFIVHERPQVQKVEFHGNRWLSKEELGRVTGLKTGSPFDHVSNRETAARIRFEYGQRGYQFAAVRLTKGGEKDDREVVFEINEGPRADVCILDVANLVTRSLADAISKLNRDSKESSVGVSQPPVTEKETRDAIAKFAAEKHVPGGVRTQLEQILKSGELPSNVYFRRFTRFDDGKQMQDVWWVRLVVETGTGPVYSVPVRTTSLSARPYTQMERQQNASENLTLLNRVSTYVDEAKFRNMPSDVFISMNIPKVRDSEIDRFLENAEAALRNSDLNALLAFHSWRETSDATREFVTAELNRLLSGTVHDVWYSPRGGHKVTTWSAWQFYKPNLPVAGFLKISYSPEAGKETSSPDDHRILALELGVDEGELRLVNYIKDGQANPPQELNPGPSITGHLEPLADGTHLVTDIITNPGSLLSAHLANEEIRLRDFRER